MAPRHDQQPGSALEQQIARWRGFLARRQAMHEVDIEELEDHLREQVASLEAAGLAEEEAFLVAVKRIGSLDALSGEFAREHSARLWKQLVLPATTPTGAADQRKDAVAAFALAGLAAISVKLPAWFGISLTDPASGELALFYLRNASLFALPMLVAYFAWKRRVDGSTLRWLGLALVGAIVFSNIYPFQPGGYTARLTGLHVPIALLPALGLAYTGGNWQSVAGRMNCIRFAGELFIYYVLLALGGGVLLAFTGLVFHAIGFDLERVFSHWLAPCGAVAGVLVAAWLVEAKQSVIENMAPVLARLFTPLFAVVLLSFLGTWWISGRGVAIERDMLIAFDLLLAVVLGLLLYSISARDGSTAPAPFDGMLLLLLVAALLVDALALAAIVMRISDFGFSPNRVAALGENIILLVNLAWSAVLYTRFLRGRGSFAAIERWQTGYLTVFALWAGFVVVVFPPLFGFL